MCVKFDWTPTNTVKMDNKIQTGYPRKLWSSLMLWNLDHPSNEKMGYFKLNEAEGIELHTFGWLQDNEIGEIHPRWNYVPGVTQVSFWIKHSLIEDDPAAVHFSEGGPWFKGYENVEYATEWNKALGKVYVDKSSNQL
jgi:lipopolysaccharide biosynthesis glycosyltransferase